MLFKNSVCSLALALLTFTSVVFASPVPLPLERPDHLPVVEKRAFGGYNDFGCKPTSQHPNPLIMLHGLLGDSGEWSYMGPRFALKGYCAFGLDYGRLPGIPLLGGLNDMMVSGQELSDFVDKVLAATGATQVDILGHSEGSILPPVYLKYFNGTTKTGSFAAIGSNQYGSSLANIVTILEGAGMFGLVNGLLNPICKACFQLITNAPFLQKLHEGGDTFPEVKYLMLVSKYDELVTPYTSGYLKTTGPNVFNVELQSLCPLDLSGHIGQATDPIAFNAIDSFLSTGTPVNAGCAALVQ